MRWSDRSAPLPVQFAAPNTGVRPQQVERPSIGLRLSGNDETDCVAESYSEEDDMSATSDSVPRLSAEDRLEILELLARYCWAIDCDDGPAWAATFVPDGVFHSLLLDKSFSGYDELVGMIETLRQRRAEGHDRNLIHVPANVVLELRDDGKVRLVAQLLGPRKGANDQADFAIGWYDDVVVRTPEGWRFEVRRHKHWPDPDLAGSPLR